MTTTDDFHARSAARMAEKAGTAPAPLHTITIDGMGYTIRKTPNGRVQAYRTFADGTEQSVGRIKAYSSLKEAFDALYASHIQD